MLKTSVAVSLTLFLAGCATYSPPTYTYKVTTGFSPKYRNCVLNKALPLAPSPDSARDIAAVSADLCETERLEVVRGVLLENIGVPYAERYAKSYGDGLRSRVVSEVAEKVMQVRVK